MINQPAFRNFLKNSLYTSLTFCILLFIGLWGILKLTWYSSLLVSLFGFLSLKWTLEGAILKSKLTEDIGEIKKTINKELRTELDFLFPEKEKHNLINKILFIENLYSKNNKAQKWEKEKRYYQSLPNILISIGLSGTFLGITINLFSMSTKISGKFNLEKVLPEIIGSMAIAFVSSLIALSLSLVLIRRYPSYELDIAKDQLFISLEFELEKTIIEKQKYLDLNEKFDNLVEAIDTYSQSLSQFIITLPQLNQQFQDTVKQSTSNFKDIADKSSQIIKDDTKIFTNTTAILQNAASNLTQLTTKLAGLTTIYSDIVNSLQDTKESLESTTNSLNFSTNSLNNSTDENGRFVAAVSNITNRIDKLIDTNRQSISQIADQLQQNINTLSGTTQSFSQNTSQITNQLQKDIQTLAGTTQSFSTNTSQITGTLNRYTTEVQNQNGQLQNVSGQIAKYVKEINQIQSDFNSLLQLLRSSQNP
ncbi:MAG: hypothetical protein HWQ35_00995 [Nostoc sp. NMS1]|uniref:hypothetical protein n=1 Tax=unclassified Nostoc TaxID=2593658 RepID=UPI0025D24F25|nr:MULTISPECIES: hypothetical protein [unclassified Nostoc]MBN3905200.1 hypothetical protein [Nostoc sp. NMS1]MBN3992695.1 hypothetical protein [Nostoc sp. NMS2]